MSGHVAPAPRDPARGRPSDLLLGIDVGTTSTKAGLTDVTGDWSQGSCQPTPFSAGEMTVDKLLSTVAKVLGGHGHLLSRAAAVGVTGVAECGAPLGPDGRPLAPIIAWSDPRGGDVVDRLLRSLGPQVEQAIGQRLRPVSSVAKLGWLVDQGVGPVRRWLGVPELVLEALTGVQATDFSLAARTGAYDVGERRPLPEVASAIGVGAGVFLAPQPAGSVMGRVSAAGAAWSGLAAGIPVTVAGHDHLGALAGSGAGPTDVLNSVGTAETVLAATDRFPDVATALAQRVAVTLAPSGDGWVALSSAARAGVAVESVARGFGRRPDDLDREAGLAGEWSKTIDGSALDGRELLEAALSGAPLPIRPDGVGAQWRSLLAALAGRTWDAYDRLDRVVPLAEDARLVVCGGGSRSPQWLALKAAARPTVEVWFTGGEAAVRGAALSAGVAAGCWRTVAGAPRPSLQPVSVSPE